MNTSMKRQNNERRMKDEWKTNETRMKHEWKTLPANSKQRTTLSALSCTCTEWRSCHRRRTRHSYRRVVPRAQSSQLSTPPSRQNHRQIIYFLLSFSSDESGQRQTSSLQLKLKNNKNDLGRDVFVQDSNRQAEYIQFPFARFKMMSKYAPTPRPAV